MRTKVTLVLIFLNVALFFFIFKFERNWRTEAASLEARRRVLGAEAADIRLLEITNPGVPGSAIRLERLRDTWLLKKPFDWPANPHAAASIVNELQTLEHEATFTVEDARKNGQSLADFGLEKPKLVVGFASGDAAPGLGTPATKLLVGDASSDGKRIYILSPDGQRIHVVGRALLDSLSTPLEQLRADTVLSIRVFEARGLNVQAGNPSTESGRTTAGARVRIRREGSTRWMFDAPITARASRTDVELAINELNALRAKSFPTTRPATLPIAAPTLRVSLDGNNRSETLFLGEPVASAPAVNAPPPAAPKTETPPATANAPGAVEYYAQLEGRNALFTVAVPTKLIETLRNAQETLRDKRILEFDPRAVTSLVIGSPMQPNLPALTLQRIDPPAGQTRDTTPSWQVVRRGEGAQGPQTLAADTAAVQRALDQLALLNALRFKGDVPTSADLEEWGFNRPIREITLTLAGNSTPLVLRIGSDTTRRTFYARPGTPNDAGTSVYTIDRDILETLSLEPLAWRDRIVGEPLPATAKIASLKLTDLNGNKVLFETTFNANGEPATAPRDPKALQTLVGGLRHLRAKEFLPGGFAERVLAAGDERPWRFQLDTAIALPGAAPLEQARMLTLFLTERLGGSLQFAGSKDLDLVFSLEQPLVDALWALAYGQRDPGPPPPDKKP